MKIFILEEKRREKREEKKREIKQLNGSILQRS